MVNEEIVVTLVTDSYYLPFALFQCEQVWKFNQHQKIFILFDSLSNPPTKWAHFIKEHPNLEFQVVDKIYVPEGLSEERHISRTTYLKMLLPIYLSQKYRAALYLDSDILIFRNLSEQIRKIDIPKHVNAVRIPDMEGSHLNGFEGPYFNAGVMLFNLNSDLVRQLPNNLNGAVGIKFKYQDQDLLNILFESKWSEISNKFNYFPYAKRNLKRRIPVIVHFIGADKPWISRQPTWYHIIWVCRWNKFVKSIGSSQLKIDLSIKQRLFPLFWNPGGRLALKVFAKFGSWLGKPLQ